MEALRSGADDHHLLVAREGELAALRRALRQARSGRTQVVVVEGEPGIGKSTLLGAFVDRERLDRTDAVRWLRCDEFEQSHRFGAVSRLLGRGGAHDSEVEVGRRLLAWFGDQQLAHPDVAVLVIDDAQWLDRASANALQFAVGRLRTDRVLCLVGRRLTPRAGSDLHTDDPDATTVLRPGRLDTRSIGNLARRMRGWELPEPVAELLRERTGGLPLLAGAALRGARDAQQLASPTVLSGSVAATVTRVLESLDPATRRLVEATAVLAEPSPLTLVAEVADVVDPAQALTAAVLSGLLVEDEHGQVDSAHDLTADAVRHGLSPVRRRELHRNAMEWTTGTRRLVHRAAAADRPDPVLAADLVAAADAAGTARRHGLAAAHRLRARAVSVDPVERERLLVDALMDRVQAEDLDGAEDLAAQLREADPGARQSLALGLLARERGEVGEARTLLRAALDAATATGDRDTATEAALAEAVLAVWIGDGDTALVLLEHTRPAQDALAADVRTDIATTRGLALWLTGRLEEALALMDEVPLSPAGTSSEAELLAVRGLVRFYQGRTRQATPGARTSRRS